MQTSLAKLGQRLRESLWVVPAAMMVAAALLAYWAVSYDEATNDSAIAPWIWTGSPEGARQVLATIGGSMITVAGVVFSITIVALTLASQQFGPRLLAHFMQDRANQFVLGTFVATFLYCLLVLRTVRGMEDTTFAPQVSLTISLALAVISLMVLIYFIHHVAHSIQADNLAARVARHLLAQIPEAFGTNETPDVTVDDVMRWDAPEDPVGLVAPRDGYLEAVDYEEIIESASAHDLRVFVKVRAGHFLVRGVPIADVGPRARLDDDTRRHLEGAFTIGDRRTGVQDIEYAASELVEIAARALSPGVNDPFTAMACVDWLGAAIGEAMRGRRPAPVRRDREGRVRVILEHSSFRGLVDASFNQVRQAARRNEAVTIRLLDILDRLATLATTDEHREVLRHHAQLVRDNAAGAENADDRAAIEERAQRVLTQLGGSTL